MKLATVTIAPRFCGPPGFGNGGYVAELPAGFASGDALDVRLRLPLPLDVALDVVAAASNCNSPSSCSHRPPPGCCCLV